MPAISVEPALKHENTASHEVLPQLLQTPAGLAIIEVQGTIHAPLPEVELGGEAATDDLTQTLVGRLEFPLYDRSNESAQRSGAWMKKVHLYVGKHQRLNGEVKKLVKPIAVLGKGRSADESTLQILEIVKYKILFASRPEPVGQ